MCIDTSDSTAAPLWSPLRALTIIGLWLVVLATIAIAMCSCGQPTPPTPPVIGSVSLSWSLTDLDGQPATCPQLGATSVALRLTNRVTGGIVLAAVACASSPGTAAVAAGLYDIAIELHASDGTTLARAPTQPRVAITGGRATQLSPVTFAAAAGTSVALSIATPLPANCRPASGGGAGITGATITLLHKGDGCAPATFVRSQAGVPVGSYTVVCSSPIVASCIEKTARLTTTLSPGEYELHVVGKVGAANCWQRDDTLVVPAPGRPLIHSVGLIRQATPGC